MSEQTIATAVSTSVDDESVKKYIPNTINMAKPASIPPTRETVRDFSTCLIFILFMLGNHLYFLEANTMLMPPCINQFAL